MVAGGPIGFLAYRFALRIGAACSRSTAGFFAQRCQASAASSIASLGQDDSTTVSLPILSNEQRKQLPALLAQLRRPGDLVQRLGGLTSLAVSYRDLSVTLGALQMRHYDLDPLVDEPTDLANQLRLEAAAADEPSTVNTPDASPAATRLQPLLLRGSFLPLKDVTLLPEDVAVDGRSHAASEPQYHPPYMDKISCWAAMQPSHMELSQPLMTGIKLFPPVEAAYPTYVDFDAAIRMLAHRTSGKRMRLQRRLLRKQDKYQIKTWDHHAGEA